MYTDSEGVKCISTFMIIDIVHTFVLKILTQLSIKHIIIYYCKLLVILLKFECYLLLGCYLLTSRIHNHCIISAHMLVVTIIITDFIYSIINVKKKNFFAKIRVYSHVPGAFICTLTVLPMQLPPLSMS